MEILPKSSMVSLRWSLLRYLTWFFEVLVLLRPKVLIIRKLLQKTVFQNFATGSHSRVSKIANFAELELDFTWMVTFQVLNMVFRSFGLTLAESIYHEETFEKHRFSKYCNQKSELGVKDVWPKLCLISI